MAVCSRDPNHVYPGHNKTCPWCQQQQASAVGFTQQTAMTPVSLVPPAPSAPTQNPLPVTGGVRRSGRGRAAAVVASVGIVGASIIVALVSGQGSPGTSVATESAESEAAVTEPQTPEGPAPEPPTSEPYAPEGPAVEPPTSELRAGADSSHSADYVAHVNAVAQDSLQVHIDFTASGRSDLRRPETSCLVINGYDGQTYLARPTAIALTTDERGNFAGSLSFPAIVSGTYGLQYSCENDYTTADIGFITVPAAGVSRFSEDYYAVVLRFDESRVQFAVHGRSDLRGPGSSCITLDGDSYAPEVTLHSEWSLDAITLVGAMDFPQAVAGSTFVYSCSGYSEVLLD